MVTKIRELGNLQGKSIFAIEKECGFGNGTINKWDKNSPSIDRVMKVANILGCSIAELIEEQELPRHVSGTTGAGKSRAVIRLSTDAQKVADRYSKLDTYGKAAVQAVMGEEEARIKEQAKLDLILTKPEPKIIPLYLVPAAAGYASPIYGSDYENYELTPEDPQGAMFAVKIQGDSMEPHFTDGSIAFCNKDPIADGDIGIFCLDGESYIKQYHYDSFMGMTYLFSLNRDRADLDKLITRSSGQYLACMGRVITRRRYPLPNLR